MNEPVELPPSERPIATEPTRSRVDTILDVVMIAGMSAAVLLLVVVLW